MTEAEELTAWAKGPDSFRGRLRWKVPGVSNAGWFLTPQSGDTILATIERGRYARGGAPIRTTWTSNGRTYGGNSRRTGADGSAVFMFARKDNR